MSSVAIFHSVLGVLAGIEDAATKLEAAGHQVLVVDQYDGQQFDDYEAASAHAATIGFPELMRRAMSAVATLPDGFSMLGFSNGGGMATFVAANRPVGRVILCSGALPLDRIGISAWPAGVSAQLHYTLADPFKTPGSVESVMRSINEAGATAQYFQYPGSGHLFADPSRNDEFDPNAAAQFWQHTTRFLSD